eukprot:CAMPEP_0174249874 /NCGR_PEP_ID=MMETSP0439-20130205/206_1 /TAXON_ID=0 /ORGANISM="Stereomyxa ramosa, Strain Chinc5" /LENGTH=2924 /DNA_ID=CAMNT_0015329805 /DNA_START=59 /DNA_END=8833 /DNA_ORIENTATION=+
MIKHFLFLAFLLCFFSWGATTHTIDVVCNATTDRELSPGYELYSEDLDFERVDFSCSVDFSNVTANVSSLGLTESYDIVLTYDTGEFQFESGIFDGAAVVLQNFTSEPASAILEFPVENAFYTDLFGFTLVYLCDGVLEVCLPSPSVDVAVSTNFSYVINSTNSTVEFEDAFGNQTTVFSNFAPSFDISLLVDTLDLVLFGSVNFTFNITANGANTAELNTTIPTSRDLTAPFVEVIQEVTSQGDERIGSTETFEGTVYWGVLSSLNRELSTPNFTVKYLSALDWVITDLQLLSANFTVGAANPTTVQSGEELYFQLDYENDGGITDVVSICLVYNTSQFSFVYATDPAFSTVPEPSCSGTYLQANDVTGGSKTLQFVLRVASDSTDGDRHVSANLDFEYADASVGTSEQAANVSITIETPVIDVGVECVNNTGVVSSGDDISWKFSPEFTVVDRAFDVHILAETSYVRRSINPCDDLSGFWTCTHEDGQLDIFHAGPVTADELAAEPVTLTFRVSSYNFPPDDKIFLQNVATEFETAPGDGATVSNVVLPQSCIFGAQASADLNLELSIDSITGDAGDEFLLTAIATHTNYSLDSAFQLSLTLYDLTSVFSVNGSDGNAAYSLVFDGSDVVVTLTDALPLGNDFVFNVSLTLLDSVVVSSDVSIQGDVQFTTATSSADFTELSNELTIAILDSDGLTLNCTGENLCASVSIGSPIVLDITIELAEGTHNNFLFGCSVDPSFTLYDSTVFFTDNFSPDSGLTNDSAASAVSGGFEWDFGTLVNNGDNSATNNNIDFQVILVVGPDGNVQGGDTLNYECSFSYGSELHTESNSLTAVEPLLDISFVSSSGSGDAGAVITNTLTIDHNSQSDGPAYNLFITIDLLDSHFDLSPASLTFSNMTQACTEGTVTESAGVLSVSCKELPLGQTIVVGYTTIVANSAVVGTTLNAEWNGTYESTTVSDFPVPSFHMPRVSPLTDFQTFDMVGVLTLSKDLDSSDISQTVNPNVMVHEVVSYVLTVTVSEGTTGLTVQDTPHEHLDFVSATVAFPPEISSTNIAAGSAGEVQGDGSVLFEFGDVVNSNASPTSGTSSFSITINAIVADHVSIFRGVGLNNQAVVTDNRGILSDSQDTAQDITVVEPDLSINKTSNIGFGVGVDSGDFVIFTATIKRTTQSNAPAFDLVMIDSGTLDLQVLNATISCDSCVANYSITNDGTQLEVYVDVLLEIDVLSVEYLVVVRPSIRAGERVETVLSVDYDSSPNDNGGLTGRTYYASVTNPDFTVIPPDIIIKLNSTSSDFSVGEELLIGEYITIDVIVPTVEGRTEGLIVEMVYPGEAGYGGDGRMNVTSTVVSFIGSHLNTSGVFVGYSLATLSTSHVKDFFGTITNVADNKETIDDQFIIKASAEVVDDVLNFAGVGLNMTVRTNYTTSTGYDITENTNITFYIIEPELTTSLNASTDYAAIGETVDFRLTVEHTLDSSSHAFDVVVEAAMDVGFDNVENIVVIPDVERTQINTAGSLLTFSIPEFLLTDSPLTITWTATVVDAAVTGAEILGRSVVTSTSYPGVRLSEREYVVKSSNISVEVFVPCLFVNDPVVGQSCSCEFEECTQGTRTESDCECDCGTQSCGSEIGGIADPFRSCFCDCSMAECNNENSGFVLWSKDTGDTFTSFCNCVCFFVECTNGVRDETTCACDCTDATCENNGTRIEDSPSCACDCSDVVASGTCGLGFLNNDCGCNCTQLDCGDGDYADDCTCSCGSSGLDCPNGFNDDCTCDCSGVGACDDGVCSDTCEPLSCSEDLCGAPKVVDAYFVPPDAAKVRIEFDKETDRAEMGPFSSCAEVFNPHSMPYLIGPDADPDDFFDASNWTLAVALCRWTDRKTLEISFSEASTILPGVLLHIKRGALHAYSSTGANSEWPSTVDTFEVRILGVNETSVQYDLPRAIISPLGLWSRCTDLLLDASQSTKTGGRPLTFSWQLVDVVGNDTDLEFLDILETTPFYEVFNLDYQMKIGVNYTVELTVTDFMGQTHSTQEWFMRTEIPRPKITLDQRFLSFSEDYQWKISGVADLPVCIADLDTAELLYEWSIELLEGDATGAPNLGQVNADYFRTDIFVLPSLTFLSRDCSYNLCLTVTVDSNANYTKTSCAEVTITASPLRAKISNIGAEALLSTFLSYNLTSALRGGHPDEEFEKNYEWSCTFDTDLFVFDNLTRRGSDCDLFSDSDSLFIPAGLFDGNVTIRIILYVFYRGGIENTFFESYDTALLTFKAEKPPLIEVVEKPVDPYVTQKVTMRVKALSFDDGTELTNVEYLWTSGDFDTSNPDNLLVPNNTFPSIILAPNTLVGAFEYSFLVTVTDLDTGISSFTVISFTPVFHPFGGILKHTQIGTAMETVFKIELKGWADGQDIRSFRYDFGYLSGPDFQPTWLIVNYFRPYFNVLLPEQANGIVVRIKTSSDAETIVASYDLTVLPATLSGFSLIELFSQLTIAAFQDGFISEAESYLASLGGIINGEGSPLVEATADTIEALIFLFSFIEDIRPGGDANVDQASSILASFTDCGATDLTLVQIMTLAQKISENYLTTNDPENIESRDFILAIVNNLINCGLNASITTNDTCVDFSDSSCSSGTIDSSTPTGVLETSEPIVRNLLSALINKQEFYQNTIQLFADSFAYEIYSGLSQFGAITPTIGGQLPTQFTSSQLNEFSKFIIGMTLSYSPLGGVPEEGALLSHIFSLALSQSSSNPGGANAPYLDLYGYDFLSDLFAGEFVCYTTPLREGVLDILDDFGLDIAEAGSKDLDELYLLCSYVDPVTRKLRADGCEFQNTFEANNTIYANCCCNHLTDFGVTVGGKPGSSGSSTGGFSTINIIAICVTVSALLFILLVVSVGSFVAYKKRLERLSRITRKSAPNSEALKSVREQLIEEGEIEVELDENF